MASADTGSAGAWHNVSYSLISKECLRRGAGRQQQSGHFRLYSHLALGYDRGMDRFKPVLWLVVFAGCAVAAFGFIQTQYSYRMLDGAGHRFGIELVVIGGLVASAAAIPLAKRKRK